MVGFAWLALRQAQDALKNERPEEAFRILCQPGVQGHKKTWELLVQIARQLVARGERHLGEDNLEGAWNDLVAAEQVGVKESRIGTLRDLLISRGLTEAGRALQAGEPDRAVEIIGQLRSRSAQHAELPRLEETAKNWVRAKELAAKGEFALAREPLDSVRRLWPAGLPALEKYAVGLEERRQVFTELLVQLHEAALNREWHDVIRLSEKALGIAPQHAEARKVRAQAWRTLEPETVAAVPQATRGESAVDRVAPEQARPAADQRFLLWIDGVGGFLVCLGAQVTIGQATPDAYVDIPLFADVSRHHATLAREAEGYLLDAKRPLLVNGKSAQRTLLQSGDRITLGSSCQLRFRQPAPVSQSARIDLASGHRLPLTVDGILLMADTLVLGPGDQAHVSMPELEQPIIIFRQKDGLGVRHPGSLSIDGQRCNDRALLRPNCTVVGDSFAFAIEPVGTGSARL